MPGTAVVRIYTDDCFVVAADGLRRSIRGREITDKQQKIFVTEQSAGLFAHALTGGTVFEEDGRTTFSVSDAVRKIANELLMEHFTSADRYVTKFGKLANDALRKGQRDGKIRRFEDIPGKPGLVTKILFAGYFKDNAFMADIKLSHDKQKLRPPQRNFWTYTPGDVQVELSGAKLLFKELVQGGNRDFAQFRSAGFMRLRNNPLSLSEADAIDLARNYFAACADPKGREFDPECEAIGGHTHIVSVKRGGFNWVVPPIVGSAARAP